MFAKSVMLFILLVVPPLYSDDEVRYSFGVQFGGREDQTWSCGGESEMTPEELVDMMAREYLGMDKQEKITCSNFPSYENVSVKCIEVNMEDSKFMLVERNKTTLAQSKELCKKLGLSPAIPKEENYNQTVAKILENMSKNGGYKRFWLGTKYGSNEAHFQQMHPRNMKRCQTCKDIFLRLGAGKDDGMIQATASRLLDGVVCE